MWPNFKDHVEEPVRGLDAFGGDLLHVPSPSKASKIMAQYPTIRVCGPYRAHHFGAILPIFSHCGLLGHSFVVAFWRSRCSL